MSSPVTDAGHDYEPRRILVVAPHADDETLGAGGTIARWAEAGHEVHVVVMTGPGPGEHPVFPRSTWETVREEATRACDVLSVKRLWFRDVPAVLVADQPMWQLNREACEVLADIRPHVLLMPFPYDLHRDHRALFQAFEVAWRSVTEVGRAVQEIHAYEVPSETHLSAPYLEPPFVPNTWIDISAHLDTKLEALACYESQMHPFPHLRSQEAVEALARFRGAQMAAEAAEAFLLIRRFGSAA